MSENEPADDAHLSDAEQIRARIKLGPELFEMSFSSEGRPMLLPAEADELAGLMIGIATSPEALRHMEWARNDCPGAVSRMNEMMTNITARIEAAVAANYDAESSAYARNLGAKKTR